MRRVYFCLVCWFSIITAFFILCSNLIFLPILLAQDLSPPTVSTGEATDVTSSSATLNGTVSGRRPSVWFEYGTTSSSYYYSELANWQPETDTANSSINGLSAATTYYYRIAAYDSDPEFTTDTAYGSEKSFTTLVATPTATVTPSPTSTPCVNMETGDATDITSNSATLNAIVCLGTTANYMYFEYGTTSGTYTNSVYAGRDDLTDNVSAKISELLPRTNYYYRIVIEQKPVPPYSGYVYGNEKSFTTLPQCEAKKITISPSRLRIKIGKSGEVTVILGGDDCVPAGNTVTATIGKIGNKRIWVTPTSQATDENGQAKFTITAKNKAGNAKVTFMIEDFPSINKTMLVKVR